MSGAISSTPVPRPRYALVRVTNRDEKVKDLQAKVGELTMDNELLQQKIERLEARRPLMHRRSQK